MTQAEVQQLFVEMEKEIKVASRKWLKGRSDKLRRDAIHDALILLADMTFADTAAARKGIIAAAEQASFLQFQQWREYAHQHPEPARWVREGRHLVLPAEGGEDDPLSVDNLPDDRPNPEEELIRKECEEAVNDLARRMGQDRTWRGKMYQLLYIEGLEPLEAARHLGIAHDAARQQAKRLKEYLRGTREAKQVRRTRGMAK